MSVIFRKTWYDLWNNKTRTALVVISIAIGVFVIGTVFGMDDQMLSRMDASHVASQPSHATLYLSVPANKDVVASVRKVAGVDGVEPSSSVPVRYRLPGEEKWRQGVILSRQDYRQQTYDLLQLRQGAWPTGNGLGLERLHAEFYRLAIGDEIYFDLDGRERAFPVTGIIRHPFSPPPQIGYEMAYFFAGPQIMEQFGVTEGTYSELLVRAAPYSSLKVKEVSSAIKDKLARQDIGVAATMYQDPTRHWGRVFLDSMNMMMRIMAIISLILSAILVLNTVTAIITQQANQIGILKSIGGTQWTIVKCYLAGVLVYGLVALTVALPLGSLAASSVAKSFLFLFNVDTPAFEFSDIGLASQVGAALLVPVLAALWPILRGAGVTVRQAIASYGLGGDFGAGRVDRLVERVAGRFLSTQYAVTVANMFRRKGRLILTQATLAGAGIMFLSFMTLNTSFDATVDADFARRDYDLAMGFEQAQRIDRVVDVAKAVPGVAVADMWFAHSATVLKGSQKTKEAGLGTTLHGVSPEAPMYRPLMVKGRWLQPGDDRVVVLPSDTARDNGLAIGEVITLDLAELGHDEWQIVGFYKALFASPMDMAVVYVPRDAVLEATNRTGRGQNLLVDASGSSPAAVKGLAVALEDEFRSRGIEVAAVQTRQGDRELTASRFAILVTMALALALMVASVGGIGLMGALSIGVIERTKEIGVLRAVGAGTRNIVGMFVMEGVLNGLMSWLVAVPLSMLAAPLLTEVMGQSIMGSSLAYRYDFQAAVAWLIVVVILSAVASLLPARSAARISVRASLAYE